MGGNRLTVRAQGRWRTLLALLCVLLVVVAGTVQVAHTHADGADTHADCSLCVAAHITVQVTHTPAPAPTVSVVAVLESLRPVFVARAPIPFALFTRPPPAASLSA